MIKFINGLSFNIPIDKLNLTESMLNFSKSSTNRIVCFAILVLGVLGTAYALMRCINFKGEKQKSHAKELDSEHGTTESNKDQVDDPFEKSLETLKEGYAVIPFLNQDVIQKYFKDLKNFDLQSESYKQQFVVQDQLENGYAALKNKSVFVIRNSQVPDELTNFIPYFSFVHVIAVNILKHIEQESNLDSGLLTEAVSKTAMPNTGNSTSLLRLFAYEPSEEAGMAADAHEDLGLLTIIPCSQIPALEVFSYKQDGKWINLEKTADAYAPHAVVLVGRTLQQMTKGQYPAALHRVIKSAEKRFSIVYQLRAEPQTQIQTKNGPITVEEWLKDLKKNLKSINGSY